MLFLLFRVTRSVCFNDYALQKYSRPATPQANVTSDYCYIHGIKKNRQRHTLTGYERTDVEANQIAKNKNHNYFYKQPIWQEQHPYNTFTIFHMYTQTQKREHYIDWIRVLAFLILIFFHCSMPFVSFNWEIKNEEHSVFLDRLIIWLHQWRLPLLFFISGVGVSFSLRKRSVVSFFGERVVRLFIPLLFAMFFLTPLQVYFERLQKGEISGSYWSFYPTVWDFIPYPEGTLTWSHMWFVVYLFVFTILLLPVFALFKIQFIKKLKEKTDFFFRHPLSNLSLSIPFILYYFTLYVRWPAQGSLLDDWFVFNSSITFYFFGFFLADLPSFWNTCDEYRKHFLAVSLVCVVVLFWKYYWSVELPKQQDTSLYVYGFFDGLQIWAILLTVVGFARRHLNFSNPYLVYLTSAVYPFYILHQTVIVAAGFYIVQWNSAIFIKLIALIIVCFLLIFGIYHFLIRPFIFTRILFGLKPKQVLEPKPVPYSIQEGNI